MYSILRLSLCSNTTQVLVFLMFTAIVNKLQVSCPMIGPKDNSNLNI